MSTEQKKTAAQRIEDLESSVMGLRQVSDTMTRDLLTIREALRLLNNKLSAVIKATNADEQLTDSVINKFMIQNNVDELKSKVEALVAQGTLVASDKVDETSFLVGRELDSSGAVINPRVQFAFAGLPPELREKLREAKLGVPLEIQENVKFELLESYEIRVPQSEDASGSPQASAPEESAAKDPSSSLAS